MKFVPIILLESIMQYGANYIDVYVVANGSKTMIYPLLELEHLKIGFRLSRRAHEFTEFQIKIKDRAQ